jgi:hypothetical protein
MGWVRRGAKDYYYRLKRVCGKVRTEAFSGRRAELEAAADAKARVERARETEESAEEDDLDAEIDRLFAAVEEVAIERLDADGFHLYKREWRRRRQSAGASAG